MELTGRVLPDDCSASHITSVTVARREIFAFKLIGSNDTEGVKYRVAHRRHLIWYRYTFYF